MQSEKRKVKRTKCFGVNQKQNPLHVSFSQTVYSRKKPECKCLLIFDWCKDSCFYFVSERKGSTEVKCAGIIHEKKVLCRIVKTWNRNRRNLVCLFMFQAAIADRIGVAEIFDQYDQSRMRLLTDEKIAWKLPFLVLRPFQFNRLHNKQLRLQIIATELSWWPQCFAFLMNSLFTHLFVNEHFMLDVSCDLLIIQNLHASFWERKQILN